MATDAPLRCRCASASSTRIGRGGVRARRASAASGASQNSRNAPGSAASSNTQKRQFALRVVVALARCSRSAILRRVSGGVTSVRWTRERARHRQTPGFGKLSSVFFTDARNLSASAPSTMRWSNESEKYAQVRIAIVSSPSGAGDHLRPLLDRAEPEDRRRAERDDRRAHERAEHAGVRDRERARPALPRGFSFLRARALGEVVERAREAGERQVVGVLDDRDDEPPVERDRDADVDTACGR